MIYTFPINNTICKICGTDVKPHSSDTNETFADATMYQGKNQKSSIIYV